MGTFWIVMIALRTLRELFCLTCFHWCEFALIPRHFFLQIFALLLKFPNLFSELFDNFLPFLDFIILWYQNTFIKLLFELKFTFKLFNIFFHFHILLWLFLVVLKKCFQSLHNIYIVRFNHVLIALLLYLILISFCWFRFSEWVPIFLELK